MRTIMLYGELGKRFGRVHRMAVRNAGEAIRGLRANHRDFENYMLTAGERGVAFRVIIGGADLDKAEDINLPSGERETIRIVPVIAGSKSGFFRVIVGAAILAAAIVGGAATFGALAVPLGSIGASMIIGGVTQLLTKPPATPNIENPKDVDRKDSYIFSGPANTTTQGAAVPLVYGRIIVGSKVISAGIESNDQQAS